MSGDSALLELGARGITDAPIPVLRELQSAGYLTLAGGIVKLTPKGRRRVHEVKAETRPRFEVVTQAELLDLSAGLTSWTRTD